MGNIIYIYTPSGTPVKGYDGNPIRVAVRYVAQTMGVAYLEASCADQWPLTFACGYYIRWGAGIIDSIDHFFYLYTVPQPERSNALGSYGGTYQYSGLMFYDAGAVLKRALWTDLRLSGDNMIHYSTRDGLSTYENVTGIVARLQACVDSYLDALPDGAPFKNYTFELSVFDPDAYEELEPSDTSAAGFKSLIAEARQFSFGDNETVLDALNRIAELWLTIGWCYDISYSAGWKVRVVIGEPNFILPDHVPVLNSEAASEGYSLLDVGSGLSGVKKYIINTDKYCNRLIPFGSDKNLPSRYYNSKTIYDNDGILNGQSDDIACLMLPIGKWGTTTGKWDWSDATETERALPDPRKAVIDSAEGVAVGSEPVTRVVRFNNDENGEIYPSLAGVTVQDLWDAIASGEQYRPSSSVYSGSNAVNVIMGASDADDDGVIPAGGSLTDNCHITIPQIGFDLSDQVAENGLGVINMLTGMCAGRSFTIRSRTYQISGDNWLLKIERSTDPSTGVVYPNTVYPISLDDKFVLTDIQMPALYVNLAEVRLYNEALKYFKCNCAYRYLYDIEVDSKWIAENKASSRHFADKGYHIAIREGYMAGTRPIFKIIFLLVDTLTITDGEYIIPTYSVTTKENLYVPEAETTKAITVSAVTSDNVTTLTAVVSPADERVIFTIAGGSYATPPTLVDNGDNTATLTFNTAAGVTDMVLVQAALYGDTSVRTTKILSYTAPEAKSIALTYVRDGNAFNLTAVVSPQQEDVKFAITSGTYTTAPTLVDNGDNTATVIFNTAAGDTDTAVVRADLVSDSSIYASATLAYTSDEDIDPLSTTVNIAVVKSWQRTRLGIASSAVTPQALVVAGSSRGAVAFVGTAGGMSAVFASGTSGTRHSLSDILNSTWHSNSLFINSAEAYEAGYAQTLWSSQWDGAQALAALKVAVASDTSGFTFTLLQKITPTPSTLVGLGYRDWCIDFAGGYLYSVAYSKADNYLDDGSNEMVIAKFALPTAAEVTLTDDDVLESFTLPVVEVRQGIMFYKNHIYIAHGAKNVGKNTMGVTDISLKSKSVVAEVDVMSAVSDFIDEIQNVFWYNGKLCICGNSSSRTYVRIISLYN